MTLATVGSIMLSDWKPEVLRIWCCSLVTVILSFDSDLAGHEIRSWRSDGAPRSRLVGSSTLSTFRDR